MQISFTFHPYGFPLTFNTDFSDLQHRFHLLSIQIPILAAQICFTFNIDFLYFQCRFPLLAVQISLTFNTDFLYFQYRFPLRSEHISIINRFKTIENIQMHRDPNRAQYTGSLNKIEKLQDVDSHYYYYLTETLNWETMYERTCKTAPSGERSPKCYENYLKLPLALTATAQENTIDCILVRGG